MLLLRSRSLQKQGGFSSHTDLRVPRAKLHQLPVTQQHCTNRTRDPMTSSGVEPLHGTDLTEGTEVATHPHPCLEDVYHEADQQQFVTADMDHDFEQVLEPESEEEEGMVLAGLKPVTTLHAVDASSLPELPQHQTSTSGVQAPLNALTSGSSRLPRLSDALRGVYSAVKKRVSRMRQPQQLQQQDMTSPEVSLDSASEYSSAFDGEAPAAALPLPAISAARNPDRPSLFLRQRSAGSLTAGGPTRHLSLPWTLNRRSARSVITQAAGSGANMGVDFDEQDANKDDREVVQETAAALRQVGVRAHEAMAAVQHVLQDTPDAAAEVAGNIMGRGNYHHPTGLVQAQSAPSSPSASRRVRSYIPDRTWATGLLRHRVSESAAPDGSRPAGGSFDGLAGLVHWPNGQSEPGAVSEPAAASGSSPTGKQAEKAAAAGTIAQERSQQARMQIAEGLRTATHTIRHPHAAAVEVAGRMLGKSNYGHQ